MPMDHSHTPEAIAERLEKGPKVNYLRDWIYGGIDGVVTTFAIAAGAVGAELNPGIVVVLGLANILADGFSMAASNYSGTKAEHDDYQRIRAIERTHISRHPEGEREEVRQIYARKGFSGHELERIVNLITSRDDVWLEVMMTEEHGIAEVQRSPILAALATFVAFLICGAVPLVPFILKLPHAAELATAMSAAVFLGIGAAKSRWSMQRWWTSALETFVIGMAAAGIAYLVGDLLSGLTGA